MRWDSFLLLLSLKSLEFRKKEKEKKKKKKKNKKKNKKKKASVEKKEEDSSEVLEKYDDRHMRIPAAR
ncbi:hypothetical protein M0802_011437 [Mischocyttarus mexicanus]|nr:hypothetical protein M0802_011437 [Mischocyttarus mexicanus]